MPEATPAAPAATPTPAQPAAAPAPAAPAAPASRGDLIAAAARAMRGETPAAAPPAPAMPSTPEAPATAAVLAAEDTSASLSTLIRQRNELNDTVQGFEAERAKHRGELATMRDKSRGEIMGELRAAMERDPAAFLQALQTQRDPVEIARELYLDKAKLEDLPPEQRAQLQAQREMTQLRREQERLRAEIAQQQQMATLNDFRAHIASALPQISKKDTPRVAALAASNPAALVHQLMEIAGQLAVERPDLGLRTPVELAALLENGLGGQLKPFEPYYEEVYEARFKEKYKHLFAVPAAAPAAPRAPEAPTLSASVASSTPAALRPMNRQERIAAAAEALRPKN